MVGNYIHLMQQGIADPSHSMANGGGKGGGSAPAPDYTPMANASEESARIGAELGREQLAENKRQFEVNQTTLKPVVDESIRSQQIANQQGVQNYNTFQSEGRPVQQSMMYDAMGLNSDEIARYNELRNASLGTARSAWEVNRAKQLAELDESIKKYDQLSSAQPRQTNSGYAISDDGRLVTSANAVSRPDESFIGAEDGLGYLFGRRQLPRWQAEYDAFAATDPKDGSVMMRKKVTDPTLLGQPAYYWAKPFQSTQAGADYSKQIKDLADRRTALESKGFEESSADNSAASGYMAQVAAASKQRQMDEAAGTAVADARAGTNQQMNQLIRQGLRMGWSPAKLAARGGQAATMGAQGQVAAANQARTQADAKRTAKLGDVYNTYAGLGSSAPTFYNAATGAGNQASGSQLGMSGQYMQGIGQGNGTIMQGQGMKVQGLGSILNSQTSAYNASMNQGDGGMGAMIGAGGSIAAAMI